MLTSVSMPAQRHYRAFGRRQLHLSASMLSEANGRQAVRLANIGLGGACVEMEGAIHNGQDVLLEITAPNLWDPLILPATAVWVSSRRDGGSRAGLRFDHAGPDPLRALVELLGSARFD